MIDFDALPLWGNGLAFLLSAGVVWIAGTRLSYFADAIARHTGLGQAVLGVLLLGGVTSLPEIAVAGSASLSGDAALATNNLLGGFAMQVAVLAMADFAIRTGALTKAVPNPVVLLQGALGILLMVVLLAGIGVGDVPFLGAGLWTWGVFLFFLYTVRMVAKAEGSPSWEAIGQPPAPKIGESDPKVEGSIRRIVFGTGLCAVVILVAGYLLSSTGEALAAQTGLGSSFFGAVFVAISTSLPEVSTVLAAVRLKRYVMAASDILGTNLFDIAVIFLVDLIYVGGPVLNEAGDFSIIAGLIGIMVTGIYLVGLIERRDPAIFGVGLDTIAVLIAYLGGIALLFQMR